MLPPIVSNFVAGESASASLSHVQRLNERGVNVILNLLGEHYHDRDPADEDAEAYLDLVSMIDESDVDACVSVKPSQIGIDVGETAFRENLRRIVEHSVAKDVFVWVDMEDHTTTDVTLDAYEELALEFDGGVGLCVQANLKRTPDDLARLADVPGKIRLVKGAYDEPAEIAYKEKSDVNEAYRKCLTFMFEEFDGGIAVGSHDPEMIRLAKHLHDEHGTDFEIQMLMGVRDDAQFELAETYEVYQYAPYGDKWMSYFYRRVRERKENLLFALRAIVS
ncbi:proline dehydrogenase family protein [Natribaculum luteum]|uniref:proline dehydrogenase n=1 Tax=Natribaculum luteum TaxID=1586232 RepID=A0ABD5P0X4_9EURY|nr:proline dehydrogenase family protein [Natribaculum luteum]